MGCGQGGVLSSGTYHYRNALGDKPGDTGLSLVVTQERPVTHGAAVNDTRHASIHQVTGFSDKQVKIRIPMLVAGGHQGGNYSREALAVFHSASKN